MTFPPEFDQKVDMKKVNLDVMRPWISTRITELLGFEDEVVIDFTIGLLEEEVKTQIRIPAFGLTPISYVRRAETRSTPDANQLDRILGEKHANVHS